MVFRKMVLIGLLVINLVGNVSAHRMDEYLQATLIGISRSGIEVEIQLTPGVAVLPAVLALIDPNGDGRISVEEERAYLAQVAREVALRVDGVSAPLMLVESQFPPMELIREGLGTIRLKLRTERTGHKVRFENHHMPQFSAYLINCLAASGDGLVVGRQDRDETQRSIEFPYSFSTGVKLEPGIVWRSLSRFWPVVIGMLLLTRMAVLLYRSKWRS